jgi:parallel beta-helix repeat protein
MDSHSNAICNRARALVWVLWTGVCELGVAGWPGTVHATACGDTLKAGEVLEAPLEACAVFPALTIEGPGRFDLNGHTISCALPGDGTLTGTGIRVTGSGARIHHGTIENCDRGVVVAGDGGHLLKKLSVKSPQVTNDAGNLYNNGIAFHGLSGRNQFIRNRVIDYAGEGFRLDDAAANENVLRFNLVTASANHAFRVRVGQDNLFLANVAHDNRGPKGGKVQGEGFRSQDRGTKFIANIATDNGDEGFRLRDAAATENLLIGNTARGNGLDPCDLAANDANPGIAITGGSSSNWILHNTVKGNCVGIFVNTLSAGNWLVKNIALNNALIDTADGNSNCDMNIWLGNKFNTSAVGPLFNEDPGCIR